MRRLLALALAVLATLPAAAEAIRDHLVQLEVRPDGTVAVEEHITVEFDLARHGIYREIPYVYRVAGGERYALRVHMQEVLADGAPVPVRRATEGGKVVLRIGDPDRLVRGSVSYSLRYQVERALRRYGDQVELYWNAVGTEWSMPIHRARVEVRLPPGTAADQVDLLGFQGLAGSRDPLELTWQAGRAVAEVEGLAAGEGVTVAVRLPATAVRLPGTWQSVVWFLHDNAYAGLPLLVLVGMTLLWWRRGRDPAKGTIAPAFTPPQGIGPAQAGVLMDDRVDHRDLAAGVVGLATRGHLTIREVWEDGQGKEPDDFELVRHTDKEAPSPFEEALLQALLGQEQSRRLSELRGELYERVPGLSARLYMDLSQRGYYTGNPDRVRHLYQGVGVGGLILGAVVGGVTSSLYLGAAVAACGAIVWAFSWAMPCKTKRGVAALRDVLGLEEYIRRAEVERMEFAAAEQQFEALLPYAVAFGLTDVWARKFTGLLRQPPSWYEGRFPTFAPHLLGWRLAALSSATRTAAAPPRSATRSGWGGGSGFGGGGFSGGGMGGGGGRAW
ncbi:MAG: DUF2207 domain-containing protein [Candidatus Bipolaricaulaceae bacterium]